MKEHEGPLKAIIIYKYLWGVFEVIFSIFLFRHIDADLTGVVTTIGNALTLAPEGHVMTLLMEKAIEISSGTRIMVVTTILIVGSLNIIEGYGLHLRRVWGEWLTVIATGAFIPLEIYELFVNFSFITLGVLILNTYIVYFLARYRGLFGKNKKAGKGGL